MNRTKLTAVKEALPIMTAYVPIAVTFGVVSISSGLTAFETILISVIVYAGGAQFMLVGLIASAVSPVTSVLSVLLINVRHVLYGAVVGPALTAWPRKHRWINAFGLTDEVFALTGQRIQVAPPEPGTQHLFVFSCYGSWVSGTVIGVMIGQAVPQSWSNTLNFALPALFLTLLIIGGRTFRYLFAAAVGAAIAISFTVLGADSYGVAAGAVAGATVGFALDAAASKKATVQDG